jgi:hypothetical protein
MSSVFLAVHQNHDYGYHALGKSAVFHGAEARTNYQLAGGWKNLRTIADATEVLLARGLRPNHMRHWTALKLYVRQAGRVVLHDGIEPVWFFLLKLTRPIRRLFGLRAENLRRLREKALPLSGTQR